MKLSDFSYELPEALIAQHALEPRDAARLLVHDRRLDVSEHRFVRDLPRYMRAGDLLVVNDTRVMMARLCGRRATGGAVELLVLGRGPGPRSCFALVKPAGRLKVGEVLELETATLFARALERVVAADGRGAGTWLFELEDARGCDLDLEQLLERSGRVPLPPYIRRDRDADAQHGTDRERYQTIFANAVGAIAAPTAGLHFTARLLEDLERNGIERASITLHVGAGTFQPITAEDVTRHVMHRERYVLPAATAVAIARTRARGGRVVAVGTTCVRVLEACADDARGVRAGSGETSIFITPGHRFQVVDALLTNFHLPCSTLLILVSAFAGRERVLRLYREAIEARYRFYSYGDAMFIADAPAAPASNRRSS